MTVEVYRSTLLEGVAHGFLGRRGGVSEGVCAGLNVGWGSDDDPEAIVENRRRAVEAAAEVESLAKTGRGEGLPTAVHALELALSELLAELKRDALESGAPHSHLQENIG